MLAIPSLVSAMFPSAPSGRQAISARPEVQRGRPKSIGYGVTPWSEFEPDNEVGAPGRSRQLHIRSIGPKPYGKAKYDAGYMFAITLGSPGDLFVGSENMRWHPYLS
jgi:hypothetical protein